MRLRKTVLGAVCCILASFSAVATTATFDWEEVAEGAGWWLTGGYTETNNGVVMASSGRAFATHPAGDNGSAMKSDYSADTNAAYFAMAEGGEDTMFTVQSIDIDAKGNGEYTPTVQGEANGTIVWTITPTEDIGLTTYTAATSGNLATAIDRIVWNTGEASTPGDNWHNKIDNLVVATGAVPPAGSTVTFDWEEVGEGSNWWDNGAYSETNNGFVMISSGRAFATHPSGGNGVAFKADYSNDVDAAVFTMSEGGADTWFTVTSIDISAKGNGEYTPTVQGEADGVVVWTIIPTEDVGLTTYAAATSGSLTNAIDRIVWNTGAAAAPGGNVQNQIDNLQIEKAEAPGTLPEDAEAVFDWEEVSAQGWWLNDGYAETNNGVVMISSGRAYATIVDGNGTALKADYPDDVNSAIFAMQKSGADMLFVVQSIDIGAFSSEPSEYTPTVQGEADGVVVWTITPAEGVGLVTYTAATSGTLTHAIDRIVWNTGAAAVPGGNYQNKIDNLKIDTAGPVPAAGGFDDFVNMHGLDGDPNAHGDADGITDYAEYVFGGNPTNSADLGTLPRYDAETGRYIYKLVGDDTLTACVLTNGNLVTGSWGTNAIVSVDAVSREYTNSISAQGRLFIKLRVE